MITIKLEYKSDKTFYPLLKEGNKIVRIAYNLFKKGYDLKNVEKQILENFSYDSDLLDRSMIKWFCQDADAMLKSVNERGQKTLIFGSKKKWKEFNKGKITKEDWFEIRDRRGLSFLGSKNDYSGNRKFQLDIENNKILFKHKRNNHYELELIGVNKRYNDLLKIQMLAEQKQCPVTYRLDDKYVYISFDEVYLKKEEHSFVKDRMVGLDLNPNFISFVISDKEELIYKEVIDITELNKTYNKNKKDYEVIHIAKRLSKLCKHYRVEMVGYEDLNMKSKDHGKGRKLNRLNNNSWNRNCFINNFKKRLNILGIKNRPVPAQYSSTIGQINNPNETDSVGAAIEISRRCYYYKKKFLDKDKNFIDEEVMYPQFNYEKIVENWKSKLLDYNTKRKGWVSLHNHLKSKSIQFRLLFKNYDFSSWSSFRNQSRKSRVFLHFSI